MFHSGERRSSDGFEVTDGLRMLAADVVDDAEVLVEGTEEGAAVVWVGDVAGRAEEGGRAEGMEVEGEEEEEPVEVAEEEKPG
jgi:hypothetical protein